MEQTLLATLNGLMIAILWRLARVEKTLDEHASSIEAHAETIQELISEVTASAQRAADRGPIA